MSQRIKPFPYQLEAIQAVKDNRWSGILEMATGTGKTFTSLLLADKFKEEYGRLFLVILIPFVHLAEQWEKSCHQIGFFNLSYCFGHKKDWVHHLRMDIRDFNLGLISTQVILTTYKSATSQEFSDLLSLLKGRTFLIADECHYFGVKGLKQHPFHRFSGKVGLSATPNRWWDEGGTEQLRSFFGATVYQYGMQEAIKNKVLTEYVYHPHLVDLSAVEIEKYEKLTKRLIYLMNYENSNIEEISEVNRKRSLILSRAESKISQLLALLKEKDKESMSHTLVYCAPGEITKLTQEIASLGIRTHRFDAKVSYKDRLKILQRFESGEIQVLVAIKCLDEGVDVPATKEAYFLASTSNPREFIQRRGRVLRKHSDKNLAIIHDFIVLPTATSEGIYKTIATKEIPRFAEFSQYAINRYQARSIVGAHLTQYALDYLMDKLPWEVYQEYREREF